MGTIFYFMQSLPAIDAEGHKETDSTRFVEIIKTSGDHELHLRIGHLDEKHCGTGYQVRFDKQSAREFLDSFESAMGYVGFLD